MHRRPSAAPAEPRGGWLSFLAVSALVTLTLHGTAVAQPAETQSADPLSEMADIGVDWPDLDRAPVELDLPDDDVPEQAAEDRGDVSDDLADIDPDETAVAQAAPAREDVSLLASFNPAEPIRYSYRIDGLEGATDPLLLTRFEALSTLRPGQLLGANVAQIRRRGRADVSLLDELLRVRGYFDSRTRLDFERGNSAIPLRVILNAAPGNAYTIGLIDIDGLTADDPGQSGIRNLFAVSMGDRADTDKINAATDALRTGLLESGYPFAEVSEPVLVIDHEQRTAALNLSVDTGGFRRIGEITVNSDAPFDARHVQVISRFKPGDPFKASDIADLNRALIATGLLSQVSITPEPGTDDGLVDLSLKLNKAPSHTISGEIGYGTGEGLRAQASWQHRNLIHPEGAVTFRGVLGEQEQSVAANLRMANFGERDRVLNGEISFAHLDQPAYNARTASVSGSLERQTNLIFQKQWIWSLGAEVLLSEETDFYAFNSEGQPRRSRSRTFLIAALPSSINYDGSDDLLDPRSGFRLGAHVSPEISLEGGAFGYVRAQLDGSFYLPAADRVTIAGRSRIGTIVGASRDRIAPTRRYYAGGGASVRGYSYQAIGPRDANNAPLGGRSLAEFSLEARVRFGSQDQFGLVPFIDAGSISEDPLPRFSEMRFGAGLGVRYYSSFGPIRIDVGTPINPQPGDPRIGVYVSLGQAF